MNNLKTKKILSVFAALISAVLLISYFRANDTYKLNSPAENKQSTADKNSNIKYENYKPVKEVEKIEQKSEFLEEDNSNVSNVDKNIKKQETLSKRDLNAATVKIPVLMYHSINVKSRNNLIITPQEFDKQIKWLKDNGFTPLFLDEIYSMITTGKNIPFKSVALTFDDGYVDNYTEAYPILKKYKFKATIFLISDTIGQPYALKENQIREMYDNNIDFQSHTASHYELSGLSYQKQLNELIRSKEAISKLLNKNVDFICYPSGKYNADTIKACKSAGYKMGFTTKPGYAKQSDGLYTLTRVRMFPGMSMQGLNIRK
ncbi:polysaccharide deacetylase family protein [Clostridium brassicae]|uniref:Polysaccharide deacetylase family protein n=1 Tax=Clostridium brassicae TaxID=2999072 RepID=A0ABT4DB32_9CLOT|nr:polysaccharide deacetylase family protein [Clostridium brassicae]MCY6959512.1 polysaccharide deacetylase family protein [Clostridium brassicae]